ncbi:hypothetical protein [Paenibacillus agilis]|uniref:hypothetical protein n=1 Tax=Paenibacillus agilis TaxID=3020863 RepID=UPI001C9853AD|nr:hypothetical protein [Paenibacillus agilis]
MIFYIPIMLILPEFIGVSGIYWGSLAIDAVMVLWIFMMIKKEFTILRSQEKAIAASL